MAAPSYRSKATQVAQSRYQYYRRRGPAAYARAFGEQFRGYSRLLNQLTGQYYQQELQQRQAAQLKAKNESDPTWLKGKIDTLEDELSRSSGSSSVYNTSRQEQLNYYKPLYDKVKLPETIGLMDRDPDSETFGETIQMSTEGFTTEDQVTADYQQRLAVTLGERRAAETAAAAKEEARAKARADAEAREAQAIFDAYANNPEYQAHLEAKARSAEDYAEWQQTDEEMFEEAYAEKKFYEEQQAAIEKAGVRYNEDAVYKAQREEYGSAPWENVFAGTYAAYHKGYDYDKGTASDMLGNLGRYSEHVRGLMQKEVMPEALAYKKAFGDAWEGGLDYFYNKGLRTERAGWKYGGGFKDVSGQGAFGGRYTLEGAPDMLQVYAEYKMGDITADEMYEKIAASEVFEGKQTWEGVPYTLDMVKEQLPLTGGEHSLEKVMEGYASMGASMKEYQPTEGIFMGGSLGQMEKMNMQFASFIESGGMQKAISQSLSSAVGAFVDIADATTEEFTSMGDTLQETLDTIGDPKALVETLGKDKVLTSEVAIGSEEVQEGVVQIVKQPVELLEEVLESPVVDVIQDIVSIPVDVTQAVAETAIDVSGSFAEALTGTSDASKLQVSESVVDIYEDSKVDEILEGTQEKVETLVDAAVTTGESVTGSLLKTIDQTYQGSTLDQMVEGAGKLVDDIYQGSPVDQLLETDVGAALDENYQGSTIDTILEGVEDLYQDSTVDKTLESLQEEVETGVENLQTTDVSDIDLGSAINQVYQGSVVDQFAEGAEDLYQDSFVDRLLEGDLEEMVDDQLNPGQEFGDAVLWSIINPIAQLSEEVLTMISNTASSTLTNTAVNLAAGIDEAWSPYYEDWLKGMQPFLPPTDDSQGLGTEEGDELSKGLRIASRGKKRRLGKDIAKRGTGVQPRSGAGLQIHQ